MDHLTDMVGSYAVSMPQYGKVYVDSKLRQYPEVLDLIIAHEMDHCKRLEAGFPRRLVGDVVSDYTLLFKLERDYGIVIGVDVPARISILDLMDNLLYGLFLLPLGVYILFRQLYKFFMPNLDRDKWFKE